MARTKNVMPTDLAVQARTLRARRSLDEIDEMRFVKTSVDSGLSQDVVAEALGASQATISRIVKKVTNDPKALRPTVAELVDRAVIKEISRTQLVERLRDMKLAYVRPERKPDSEWAVFGRAVREGLVTKREAEVIAGDVAARLVGRVGHAMDLEGQTVADDSTQRLLAETTQKLMADL